MFVNPLHLGMTELAADYEEPVVLHPVTTRRPRVEVDSELYVADQRASPPKETEPLPDSTTYHVFRSDGLAQNPDAAA
jgi:hypothetical protein